MKRALLLASTGLVVLSVGASPRVGNTPVRGWQRGWPGFGRNAQHTAQAPAAAQPLERIRWQAPVDLMPQYADDSLLIHYGSPLITAKGNVLLTVKTGETDGFRVECRRGGDGVPLWSQDLDYSLPPHNWTPSCGPALTPGNQAVMPAAGGTVLRWENADRPDAAVRRLAFYGLASHDGAPAAFDATVKISTPITADARGNVYFGFVTLGTAPLGLTSGVARLDAEGNGTWISAAAAAGDGRVQQVPTNCAPAVSADGQVVYVAVRDDVGAGYLVGLSAATLAPLHRVRLKDPASSDDAGLSDDGTSSPTIGPDGDVFYGVMENPAFSNHLRGWLLHFDASLTVAKVPGAFGWDSTPAIVAARAVPSYSGSSPYLLVTKYNDYAQGGGDGVNKVAVLDPSRSQRDAVTGGYVMAEVLTKACPTPDPETQGPGSPYAVREWCINTAAVDPAGKCALANNEDGKLYRWDFTTNTFSETIVLTPGIGEAYTPTCVGPDGTVYAINNATLFAVGR